MKEQASNARSRCRRSLAFALLAGLFAASTATADWTNAPLPGQQTTTTGSGASGIGVDAAGRRGVVSNKSANTANILNLDSGGIAATLALAAGPDVVVVNSANVLAYVLHESGKISVINLATRTKQAEWAVSGSLRSAVLMASGSELVVADDGNKRLIRVSASTGQVLQHIALANPPRALALSGDEKLLFVAKEKSGISVLDTTTWAEIKSIPLPSAKAMAWWPGGNALVAVSGAGVTLIDPVTASMSAAIAADAGPRGVALDNARGIAYIASAASNSISAIDLAGKTYLGHFSLGGAPKNIAYDPVAEAILVTLKDSSQFLRVLPASATLVPTLAPVGELQDLAVNNATHHAFLLRESSIEAMPLTDRAQVTPVVLTGEGEALALDEAKNLVVAATEEPHRIVFYDHAAGVLHPEQISFSEQISVLAVDPERSLALAVEKEYNRLHFISTDSRVLLKSLSLASGAKDVAVHAPSGLGYVLHKKQIGVVDLAAKTIVASITLGDSASRFALDRALNLLLVTYGDARKAQILDLKTRTVLKTFSGLPAEPKAVAIHPDTHVAVVASEDSNTLSLIDLQAQSITPNFAAAQRPKRLAIGTRFNQALVIGDDMTELQTIQLPNPVPVLSRLVPPEADSLSLTVAALGERFIDGSRVNINGADLTTRWLDGQRLDADLPAALVQAPGSYPAKVVTPAPGGGASNVLSFLVKYPVPVLFGVDPLEIPAGGERSLALTGSQFVPQSQATFAGQALVTTFVNNGQLAATVPAALSATAGDYPVRVQNPAPGGGPSNPITVKVAASGPTISGIAPASGEPGSFVTLSGTGFETDPTKNLVTFAGNAPASVVSASATALKVKVPPTAQTGAIAVATPRGTAQSPVFTVVREQDFGVMVGPSSQVLIQGAQALYSVQLSSAGTQSFNGLVKLKVAGLPAGVSAKFAPATLAVGQAGTLTLTAAANAPPGEATLTIEGESLVSGVPQQRTAQATLNLQAASGQTGVKGRFVTPDGQGIGGIRVKYDTINTVSDAAGNFLLVGLPSGKLTLNMDATPAHPLYPIWPAIVELAPGQISLLKEWTITPPPADDKFTAIANATQNQIVTDPRYPGAQVILPAGVSIVGWDGVVKTRIAMERIQPDKLGIPPPPVPTKEHYQLFFGTPMGGIPSQPIPVSVPNVTGLEPGDKTEIWYFDGSPMYGSGEWKVAGTATISADGQSVTTDPGQGIPRFCGQCGIFAAKCPPLPTGYAMSQQPTCSGKPVDLYSGYEMPNLGGLNCGGLNPIAVGLSYHPVDIYQGRSGLEASFGQGWFSDYEITLADANAAPDSKRLILPGHARINFVRQPDGTYIAPGDMRFQGAVLRLYTSPERTWELTFADGKLWRFGMSDPTGLTASFLMSVTDPKGNTVNVTRRADRKIAAVGTAERAHAYTYGANGLVSQIADPAGRSMKFTYNAARRIEIVTDAEGGVTKYTYVDDTEYPASPVCTQGTDGLRIKTMQFPGVNTTLAENFHGSSRRVLRQVSHLGEYKFAYQVIGACITHVSNPNTGCTTGCPSEDSWDAFQAGWRFHGGQVVATRVTEPSGKETLTRFNAKGVTLERSDNEGTQSKRVLNDQNRVVRETDILGRVTRYGYDERGNVALAVDALNRVTETAWHSRWSLPETVTRYLDDGTPVTTQNSYDGQKGLLLQSRDPLNQLTKFTYTPRGELEAITDPLNHVTRVKYNAAGDLTQITDSLDNIVRMTHDGAGRVVNITDPRGFDWGKSYTGLSQPKQITDPLGKTITQTYNPEQRLESVQDQNGKPVETYGYDPRGHVVSRTDALGKAETYLYDDANRLSQITTRKGEIISYTYDSQNRVTRVTRPDGATDYSFDAVGRLIQVAEGGTVIQYSYDAGDRKTRETVDSPNGHIVLDYQYDTLNRRTSRKINGADETKYAWDKAGRLTDITYRGETTHYTWDDAGRLIKKTLPGGYNAVYAWDNADRIKRIEYRWSVGNTLVEAIDYDYDAAGNIVRKALVSGQFAPETPITAQYDAANRMSQVTLTASGKTYDLTYDDNGNLIRKQNTADPADKTDYAWDSRNRLKTISAPSVDASFDYDPRGRRVSRTVNGQTTHYVYDGVQAVGELRNGRMDALLTGVGVDEAIARYSQAGQRTQLTDALNSVLIQVRMDGTVVNQYFYSPYGEVQASADDEGNASEYTARENDGTGLYFYRARYYDPVLKRFISEDPIGTAGGVNLMAYVRGGPVGMKDAFGLETMPKGIPWGKAVKKIVCSAIGAANNANNWGQNARIQGEMELWQENHEMISNTLLREIEICQMLRPPPTNQCPIRDPRDECIEEAIRKAAEARRREDERHNAAMEELLKLSPSQKVGSVLDEICSAL